MKVMATYQFEGRWKMEGSATFSPSLSVYYKPTIPAARMFALKNGKVARVMTVVTQYPVMNLTIVSIAVTITVKSARHIARNVTPQYASDVLANVHRARNLFAQTVLLNARIVMSGFVWIV